MTNKTNFHELISDTLQIPPVPDVGLEYLEKEYDSCPPECRLTRWFVCSRESFLANACAIVDAYPKGTVADLHYMGDSEMAALIVRASDEFAHHLFKRVAKILDANKIPPGA